MWSYMVEEDGETVAIIIVITVVLHTLYLSREVHPVKAMNLYF